MPSWVGKVYTDQNTPLRVAVAARLASFPGMPAAPTALRLYVESGPAAVEDADADALCGTVCRECGKTIIAEDVDLSVAQESRGWGGEGERKWMKEIEKADIAIEQQVRRSRLRCGRALRGR